MRSSLQALVLAPALSRNHWHLTIDAFACLALLPSRRMLGPNLKTLALLLLPVPLLLYPILVAVGGIFSGIAVGAGNAAKLPKDTSCSCSNFVFLHTCT